MNKFFKAAVIFAVTALILTAPVFAQAELASNTSKATAGVFTSAVDDSMDVHSYSDVEFDKWLGFIGYGGNTTTNPVHLGFATRFGALYLGTWYTGNIVQVRERYNDSVTTNYDLVNQIQGNKVTRTTYTLDNNYVSSNNQLEVLIGVAGMGFKIGFWENVTTITHPFGGWDTDPDNGNRETNNKVVTETEYPDGRVEHASGDIVEYSRVSGNLFPSLTWGMKIDLGSVAIRPKLTAGIDIGLDNSRNDYWNAAYTTVNGELIGNENINRNGNENGYIAPDISASIGIDFEKFSLDIGYGINFPIYSNNYDAAGFSGDVAGTVWWWGSENTNTTIAYTTTTNALNLGIEEWNKLNHSISLSLSADKEVADGLKLGLSAGVDVGINTSTSDYYTLSLSRFESIDNNAALSSLNYKTESEQRSFTSTESVTEFTLEPSVNFGASFALIPDRFTINAGIGLRPFGYTSEIIKTSSLNGSVTKEKTLNSKGDVISETVTVNGGEQTVDSVNVSNTWNYLSAGLFGGFVFNFTDSLALDTSFGWYAPESTGSASFSANVSTLNVLLSFKF